MGNALKPIWPDVEPPKVICRHILFFFGLQRLPLQINSYVLYFSHWQSFGRFNIVFLSLPFLETSSPSSTRQWPDRNKSRCGANRRRNTSTSRQPNGRTQAANRPMEAPRMMLPRRLKLECCSSSLRWWESMPPCKELCASWDSSIH